MVRHFKSLDLHMCAILEESMTEKSTFMQETFRHAKRSCDYERTKEEALQNPLILQKIFAHLSTSFLLTSCSLVNKNWNSEARKYVRDQRKCLAMKPGYSWLQETPCELLRQLDLMCGSITEQGRIVPWNCLKLMLMSARKCRGGEERIYENLKINLKLRILEVSRSGWDCPVHKPFLNLLHFHTAELKRLMMGELPPHIVELLNTQECVLQFPKLEQIVFDSDMSPREAHVRQKQAIRRMLHGAVTLRKVFVKSVHQLEIVPEELYNLLANLDFQFRSIQDEKLFRAIISSQPALTQLFILKPEVPRILTVQRYHNSTRHHQLPQKFDALLAQLLAMCGQSLKHVHLRGHYQLYKLPSFPPLMNLSKLTTNTVYVEKLDEFWTNIVSTVDRARTTMPRLVEMEIITYISDGFPVQSQATVNDGVVEWPKTNVTHTCSSVSIRKLMLELHVKTMNVNMSVLKSTFPNVNSLEFKLYTKEDLPIFTKIFEFWSDLRELRVTGLINQDLKQSFDAEFCGILEQEAELLREKDEDYLRAAQIVPIRPSLLTMWGKF